MNNFIDLTRLQQVEHDDVYDHVCEYIAENSYGKRLGFVDRSKEVIEISLERSNISLTIKQSFSGESTGFVCWQSASYVADWLLSGSPFMKNARDLTVVEVGAGVSAVLASTIGVRFRQYIATDQRELLKLLKRNFEENVNPTSHPPQIEFAEFDWTEIDHGLQEIKLLQKAPVDFVIACDTVYNDFLIPHFVAAVKLLMNASTGALICIQLRDPELIQIFIEEALATHLKVYSFPKSELSPELSSGFALYYLSK